LWAAKEQLQLSLRQQQHFKSGDTTKEKQRKVAAPKEQTGKAAGERGKAWVGLENGRGLSLGLAESGLL